MLFYNNIIGKKKNVKIHPTPHFIFPIKCQHDNNKEKNHRLSYIREKKKSGIIIFYIESTSFKNKGLTFP